MTRPLVALLALACACGVEETRRDRLAPASDPAGAAASVLDNPLHRAHLATATPLPCSACHEGEGEELAEPSPARCLGCHPERSTTLHSEEIECQSCHAFAAGATRNAAACQRCHADRQGDHPAITAHARVDCTECHVAHGEPSLAVATCTRCHEDHQQKHGKPNLSLVERCSQCHLPHTRALEAVTRCESCHQEKLVRAIFRGHDRCETCHGTDRRSAPAKRVECNSCHRSTRPALAAASVADHARCESCHAPHDPRGTAILSCQGCHDDLQPSHPTAGAKGSCVGCHAAHPVAAQPSVTCSRCHQSARSETAFHAPGKTACSQCHPAHEFSPLGCQSCHARQTALTASSRSHQDCRKCHKSAHDPGLSQIVCGDCHVAEHKTSPQGHRTCSQCHEPHSGQRRPGARCESCHADRTSMLHGQLPGGCETCHRAHGPGGVARPPKCTSCHRSAKLPALHAVSEHQKCDGCHRGHSMPTLGRDRCIGACHVDKVNHEPVAKTCVGCHPFGGSP